MILDRLAGLAGLALLGLGRCGWRLAAGHGDRVIVAASILGLGILVGSGLALWLAPRRSKGGDPTSGVASRFRVFREAFATASREPQAVRWGTVLGSPQPSSSLR
jgi:hypothetical protein